MTVRPFKFRDLTRWTRPEARLWNWFHSAFPRQSAWAEWLEEVFTDVLTTPSGRRATLTITNTVQPDAEPQLYRLEEAELTIGRDESCQVVLPESVITKRHARITAGEDGYLLEDLGSAMGTFRRNKKLAPHEPVELTPPDRFSIFPYNFRFEVEAVWSKLESFRLGRASMRPATAGELADHARKDAVALPVRIDPIEAPLLIEVESGLLGEVVSGLAPSLGEEVEGAGLTEIDWALAELALLALWERANRDLAWDFRFSVLDRGAAAALDRAERGIAVTTTLSLRRVARLVRLFLPFRTIERMRDKASIQVRRRAPPRMTWSCPVSLAGDRFTPKELASLEPGDAVLLSPAPKLWLPGGFRHGWRLIAEDSNFRAFRADKYFEGELPMAEPNDTEQTEQEEPTGPEEQAETEETSPSISLDELPVALHVVLGEQRLSLGELEGLHDGAVIELDRAPDAPVDLVANGARVGRGELVDIEGKLGVRVTEWFPRS